MLSHLGCVGDYETDIAYPGNDINDGTVDKTISAEDCQALCKNCGKCKFWTWGRGLAKDNCWLKSGKLTGGMVVPGGISGARNSCPNTGGIQFVTESLIEKKIIFKAAHLQHQELLHLVPLPQTLSAQPLPLLFQLVLLDNTFKTWGFWIPASWEKEIYL